MKPNSITKIVVVQQLEATVNLSAVKKQNDVSIVKYSVC